MAYSAAVSVTKIGPEFWSLVVVETEAGAATEAVIQHGHLPIGGRVHRHAATLDSGTGTTIDPVLGVATNPTTDDVIVSNDTAAAAVDNLQAGGVPYLCQTTNTLYLRSVCDAGSDNVVTHRITISGPRYRGP